MIFITANQIVAHLVGDYLFQSDWMAQRKTKSSLPAMAHALTYTVPFFMLADSFLSLAAIAASQENAM